MEIAVAGIDPGVEPRCFSRPNLIACIQSSSLGRDEMRLDRIIRHFDGGFWAAAGAVTMGLGLQYSSGSDGFAARSLFTSLVAIGLFMSPKLVDLGHMTMGLSLVVGWVLAIVVWAVGSSIPPYIILATLVVATAGAISSEDSSIRPIAVRASLIMIWVSVFAEFLAIRELSGAASILILVASWLFSRGWRVSGIVVLGGAILAIRFSSHLPGQFFCTASADAFLHQAQAAFAQGGFFGQVVHMGESVHFPVRDHLALAGLGFTRGWMGVVLYMGGLLWAISWGFSASLRLKSRIEGEVLFGFLVLALSATLLSTTHLLGWQRIPGPMPILSMNPALTILTLWAFGLARNQSLAPPLQPPCLEQGDAPDGGSPENP